jgi:hypothetical protein
MTGNRRLHNRTGLFFRRCWSPDQQPACIRTGTNKFSTIVGRLTNNFLLLKQDQIKSKLKSSALEKNTDIGRIFLNRCRQLTAGERVT